MSICCKKCLMREHGAIFFSHQDRIIFRDQLPREDAGSIKN